MIDKETRSNLKEIYSGGNITLFLGAGISADNGLPNWNELVKSLFFRYMTAEEWHRIKPFPNYLQAVSQWYLDQLGEASDIVVRGLKTGWDGDEYHSALWEVLYNSIITNNSSEQSVLLNSIGNVITHPQRKIKSVITYNYDNLLEKTLKRNNFTFQPIFSPESFSSGKFPVYHVHGYIPYDNNPDKKCYGQIVLSEEDYNSIVSDSNFWGNLVQITALASTTNIMIGLSLTDRNLRRILDIISRQPFETNNYIFLKKKRPPELSEDQIEDLHREAQAIFMRAKSNPMVKSAENRLIEIPQILQGVVYNHSRNQERIFQQLKIKPIWYEEHNEVGEYLRFMQKDNQTS